MTPDLYVRKFGLWKMLDLSARIFSRNLKGIFVFVFLFSAVLKGLDLLVFQILPVDGLDRGLAAQLQSLVTSAFSYLSTLAVILIVLDYVNGRVFDWKRCIRSLCTLLIPGFVISLLIALVSALMWVPDLLARLNEWSISTETFLSLSGVVVSLSLMVYFTFVYPALVIRGKQGGGAFVYSFGLVRGRWWKVFGLFAVFGLGIICLMVFFALIFRHIFSVPFSNVLKWLYPLFALFGSYFSILITLLFLNLDRENGEGKENGLECLVDPA